MDTQLVLTVCITIARFAFFHLLRRLFTFRGDGFVGTAAQFRVPRTFRHEHSRLYIDSSMMVIVRLDIDFIQLQRDCILSRRQLLRLPIRRSFVNLLFTDYPITFLLPPLVEILHWHDLLYILQLL